MKLFTLFAILATGATSVAGDDPEPRKIFRESKTYPFVFRPEGYLATSGPVPMRTEAALAVNALRLPPALPASAKATEKPVPSAELRAETPPAPSDKKSKESKGAKGELPLPEPDLTKVPDEVLGFFRDNVNERDKRNYLFDPIFQPAQPHELPKSKATYRQKP